MRTVKCGVLVVFSLISCFGQSGVVTAVSPVPLWPRDGNLSADLAKHSIFFDPVANEVIVIPDPAATAAASSAMRFELHNQANAAVTSTVSRLENGSYAYEYTVAVSARSRRALRSLNLLVPVETARKVTAPAGWGAPPASTDLVDKWVPGNVGLEYAQVSTADGRGLPAGGVLTFRLTSELLPGYVTCFAQSAVSKEITAEQLAALPAPVLERLRNILSPQWDSREITVVGPRYSKGLPGSALVSSLQYSIRRLVNDGQLDKGSEFVQSALAVFEPYLISGRDRAIVESDLEFLSKGKTPKEREVAEVLRLTLLAVEK
jgi:hypothetical protein